MPKPHLETLYGYLNQLFMKVTEADVDGLTFNGEGHRIEPLSGDLRWRKKAVIMDISSINVLLLVLITCVVLATMTFLYSILIPSSPMAYGA